MGPNNYDTVVRYLVLVLACIFQGISLEWQVRDVIDLLQSLNTSHGYHSTSNNTAVLSLQDSARYLKLPDHVLVQALQFLKDNNEITFLATVRQEVGDSGSIIAFSSDIIRFLELESSGRRSEIRFHYTHDQEVQVETFPYRLADNMWHKVALSLSGTRVTLLVNCSKIYERVIKSVDKEFTAGKLSLFIGQRNGQHALFRGALKDVKIVTQAHGYLLQCPSQNTDCPTCAQYQDLEAKVEQMYTLYENLSVKLLQAEERLTDLEKCECQKNCYDNSTVYKEGDVWSIDKCTDCECMNGSINCKKLDCPMAKCKNPVYNGDDCCPVCLNDCYYHGQYYDHGEISVPRPCVICRCNDGNMICEKEDSCPPLNCSKEDQLSIQGVCCPVCRGTDYCSRGHDCHVNATCVNLDTRYACQCLTGFHGDGRDCEDVDECLSEGGHNGHHCYGNTVCVNTIGAYKCKCAGGHQSGGDDDDDSCQDVDECSLGHHSCSPHSLCLNTPGSYICHCQNGYQLKGDNCLPVCRGGCQNGGFCVGPDICSCRHGYMGPACEIDVDECALGISSCSDNTVCVNLPGWYHCECQTGYQSLWPNTHFNKVCHDVDECAGEGEGHTCHPSMTCVNIEGTYLCQCQDSTHNTCRPNCVYEGMDHPDSSTWITDQCTQCTCQTGVTSCQRLECDCSSGEYNRDCCPQCDLQAQCEHQQLPLFLHNGQQWVFQCQTCECLNGEVDCWPLECPPISCQSVVQDPGDCCPRCVHDNPCLSELSVGGIDLSMKTCRYKNHTYSHADMWSLDNDPCTLCECRGGHICCAFNQTCLKNMED